MTPEEMIARVLYRDGLMLVVDKPPGIAVHRGPKGGGAFEDYFDALRYGLPRPPSLAHRLDKDTSGCLVLGRHRKALAHLGLLFKHSKIDKTYWAVVEGGPVEDEGTIDIALGKLNEERGWWMKPDPHGFPSQTRWKVMGRGEFSSPSPVYGGASGRGQAEEGTPLLRGDSDVQTPESKRMTWLAMEPITGRTHQLRVHSAAMGWPIIGDNIYGKAPRFDGPILHLHAREVVIPISKNKPAVKVTAPVPQHMKERLRLCGWQEEEVAAVG